MSAEERDPRLSTANLEAVVKSWVEMGLAVKSPQALFAEEILRLRSGLGGDWTEARPTEPGWYWVVEKPDPASMYPHKVNTQVQLAHVRRCGTGEGTFLSFARGGEFLYKRDLDQLVCMWAPAAIPVSPYKEPKRG